MSGGWVDVSDSSSGSYNLGDISQRSGASPINFGITGGQIQNIAIVAAIAVVVVVLLSRKR